MTNHNKSAILTFFSLLVADSLLVVDQVLFGASLSKCYIIAIHVQNMTRVAKNLNEEYKTSSNICLP